MITCLKFIPFEFIVKKPITRAQLHNEQHCESGLRELTLAKTELNFKSNPAYPFITQNQN